MPSPTTEWICVGYRILWHDFESMTQLELQKFCDICKYHDVKSDKNFSDMTKLLN